ncbi:MAG: enoyl-CoA hydratase/isomerase family protein [Pseudolysinimonas sp.]|uniref:enoyl-CoA hydratase/isomerase family protein n=1 Tax=Pseudolysinimonas sp. TaxID=2680009 RepID=UPI003C74EEFB
MTHDQTPRLATVTIEGTGRNLLDPTSMARLVDGLRAADDDRSVSGIVLTGAGDVFCGGLDVGALRAGADPVEFATALVALLKIFPLLTKPVVAQVNGDAVASGASIVAACDYAVAVPTALIGTYEVSVGIWPMVAQVPLIKRLGVRAAMENIGAGEPFTAQRAQEIGLINRVVEPGELATSAEGWLQNAARAGGAVAAGRPSAHVLEQLPYAEALDRSLEMFAAMFAEGSR